MSEPRFDGRTAREWAQAVHYELCGWEDRQAVHLLTSHLAPIVAAASRAGELEREVGELKTFDSDSERLVSNTIALSERRRAALDATIGALWEARVHVLARIAQTQDDRARGTWVNFLARIDALREKHQVDA